MEKLQLSGVIPAFYAAYEAGGDISTSRQHELAEKYYALGVRSLYVNGSSGEGMMLTSGERKRVLEDLAKAFGDKMTLIVHVGAPSTRESCELAAHAREHGARALSAVPSVYYRITEDEVREHWNRIIEAGKLPFIAYNIPSLTGFDAGAPFLAGFRRQNGYLQGVKNTTTSAYQIEQYRRICGDDFNVINGPDEQYIAGRLMGACAGIGGTYGIMPELYLYADRCVRAKDMDAAYEAQRMINDCLDDILSFHSFMAAAKALVRLRYVDIGETRRPVMPLSAEEMKRVPALYEKIESYVSRVRALESGMR